MRHQLVTILAALALTGCASMSPTQKKVATVVGSVLVVGAIAAHQLDNGNSSSPTTNTAGAIGAPGVPCVVQMDGSCR